MNQFSIIVKWVFFVSFITVGFSACGAAETANSPGRDTSINTREELFNEICEEIDCKNVETKPSLPEDRLLSSETGGPNSGDNQFARQSERFSAALKKMPMRFVTPKTGRVDESFRAELEIQTVQSSPLKTLDSEELTVVSESIILEPIVEVRLSGLSDAFIITAETPISQRLSDVINTTWTWALTPKKSGNHQLIASIYSAADEDAKLVARKEVNVTVSVAKKKRVFSAFSWIEELLGILAAIATIIGGWLAYRQIRSAK